jgi:hypothetical protein
MCIAILNTKKAGKLPKSYIKNSWENNDMGAGLLWTEKGKLNTFKTYEYDEFEKKYYSIRRKKETGNIVLHFRIATSGFDKHINLHPFLVNDDLGFVHNGVLYGLGNKKYSDTYEFNEMLKTFKHDFLSCKMTRMLIEQYIDYSKLIFLAADDKYTIINEKKGHWAGNNWYSNDSYKQVNSFKYYGNQKVFTPGYLDEFEQDLFEDTPSYKQEVSADDEWEMYEYICDVYGEDPDDPGTWDTIEYYMSLNNAFTIPELYNILTEDYARS